MRDVTRGIRQSAGDLIDRDRAWEASVGAGIIFASPRTHRRQSQFGPSSEKGELSNYALWCALVEREDRFVRRP